MRICNYPDYFLKFYSGSPAGAVVEQITGRHDISVFLISPPGGDKVLRCLQRLSELEDTRPSLYTYDVLAALCALWAELCRIITIPQRRQGRPMTGRRMADFLKYIEQNYSGEISLASLAGSANVSKSECLRCFKESLQTTPYKYLTEYRLSRAAEYLRSTNETIGNIAADVGFQQMSHFGKCFREKTGLTPSQYRKLNQ